MSAAAEESEAQAQKLTMGAIACAVLGLAALVMAYWLVLPSIVFGIGAIVLGVMARRRSGDTQPGRDRATIAVTLGVVAVLMTPVILMHTAEAEDWGRDCAHDPNHDPNC